MIISEPFDGWGNKVLQQCFARGLAERTGYNVNAPKIPWLVNSGDYRPTTHSRDKASEREVFISHKGAMRHKVDMNKILNEMPCTYRIHSYLEYYPNIQPYHDMIVNDWVKIIRPKGSPASHDNLSAMKFYKHVKKHLFESYDAVDSITDRDLVLSVRLGRDYLRQHKYRLLLGDYFKIILDSVDYDRVFITSQDPYNDILKDLYDYDPIFVHHITPIHTLQFVKLFNNIAISQSTYSWWAAYLSDADNIYFPITKDGPWSYGPHQRKKWRDFQHDLMVPQSRYKYVSYKDRHILGDYKTTREELQLPPALS